MYIPCIRKGQIFLCEKPQNHSDFTKKFTETDIIIMLGIFFYSTFVMFGGRVLRQTVGIPIGTNCSGRVHTRASQEKRKEACPILLQGLRKKNEKKPARFFKLMFRYTDAVFSLKNSTFGLV